MTAQSVLPKYPGQDMMFVASTTWANIKSLYPATSYDGRFAFATDLGANSQGVIFRSVGGKWVKVSPFVVFANGASTYAVQNTSSLTTALTITIPGGIIGTNGYLRIWTGMEVQATANTKTISVAANGNALGVHSQATSANVYMRSIFELRTAGAENDLRGLPGTVGNMTSGSSSAAIDTSQDWSLTIRAQMGSASETVTVSRVLVEAF